MQQDQEIKNNKMSIDNLMVLMVRMNLIIPSQPSTQSTIMPAGRGKKKKTWKMFMVHSCWIHGAMSKDHHTSGNCTTPTQGH
eukprot:9561469-Ditylum_brightwellii.AAC.1